MYRKIKAHWKEAYTLSANANFRKFLYNLKHGGPKAMAFIHQNADLMAMVCEDIDSLRAYIRRDNEAAENKTYFYNLAMRQLPDVKTVLRNKFDSTLVYAHAWHPDFDLDGLTPENFLPELDRRQRAEAVQEETKKELPETREEKQPEPEHGQEPEIPEAVQEETKKEAPKRKPRTKKS